MKKFICLFIFMFLAISLFADWDPVDEHKMHFPQLPDPTGYDVNIHSDTIGDDWQCSASGYICDIHFWMSWRNDNHDANIAFITATIYSDIPADPPDFHSRPGNELWSQDLVQSDLIGEPGTFHIRDVMYEGLQGWYDPDVEVPIIIEQDHLYYYQVNLTCDYNDPNECFWQTMDEIYWLVIEVEFIGQPTQEVGWKTSQNHFNDNAVYWNNLPPTGWVPLPRPGLHDPYELTLDLAFVVNGQDTPCPVELSSFTAAYSNGSSLLQWTTQSETNNMGWNIYRSETGDFAEEIIQLSDLLEAAGTTPEPTDYSFADPLPVSAGTYYWYWIESVSITGECDLFGPVSLLIPQEGQEQETPAIPEYYGLYQNYPNPFNPDTEICFALKEAGKCELEIYDIKGQKIRNLFSGEVEAEQVYKFTWDGRDSDGNEVSSGIYFYKMKSGRYTSTRKMILMK